MSTTWKPAWYGLIATGDGWEVTINQTSSAHTWEAECFGRSETGDADTEDEAKAAALAWIADTLREVPTRAAVALVALGEKAPTSPASASESATLPETPPASTERPVGLVRR